MDKDARRQSMGFSSILPAFPASNRSSRDVKNGLGYSVSFSKNGSAQAVLTIGKNLCAKAGLSGGDKVDVLTDKTGEYGLIQKIENGNGRKLSPRKGENFMTVAFKFNANTPMVKGITELENVVVLEEGILFSWPPSKKPA